MTVQNCNNCNVTGLLANNTYQSLGKQCMADFGNGVFHSFLQMFYIIFPSESTFESPEEVPNYEVNLLPMIAAFVIIEQVIRLYQRKDVSRFTDIVTNLGSALIFTLARIFFLGVAITIFNWLYVNYRIIDLPLNSVWTWILSLLLVEFVYYWSHRALHEFNILWAAHQFHHMAEDLNVTTAIRDSVVDLILYDVFPLPLAILVPPQILIVHMQFSLIYQVWLHNSVIGNLGFLEYVINTPRQHLVHHGKNPYCIDKNYGALLMIFDRIFGTYQREKKDDQIVFGVVSPTAKTYDPMILQFGYYEEVWKKFKKVEGFRNKMWALFKGPGWAPGKPRLGLISDVPEPDPKAEKYTYDPKISFWRKYYVGVHGFVLILGFYLLSEHPLIRFSYMKGLAAMSYIIFTLTSFGAIFDTKRYAPLLEILRCLIYYPFDYYIVATAHWDLGNGQLIVFNVTLAIIRIVHLLSIVFWSVHICIARDSDNEKPKIILLNSDNSNGKSSDYLFISENEKNLKQSECESKISPATDRRLQVYQVFILLASLLLSSVIMFFAFFIRVDSCIQYVNEFTEMFYG